MKKEKRFLRVLALAMICVLAFATGCTKKEKITGKSIAAEIDGMKITREEAEFYVYMQQANYEAYYLAYEQEIDWDAEYEEEGVTQTLTDVIKEESLEIIYKQKLFEAEAVKLGVTLDDADYEEIAKEVKTFLEDSDKDLLAKIGTNEELVNNVYKAVQLYIKVCDKILESNPVSVTDEEAHQGMYTLAIIDAVESDSPEDTAKAILARVQNGESIEYVADKYGVETSTGNVGKGDMNNALEDLCLSLKTGESGIVLVEDYYYVVFCEDDNDEEATKIAKEQILAEKEAEVIGAYYEDLKEKATIKVYDKVLDSIKITNHIFTMEDMEAITTTGKDETTGENETKGESETTGGESATEGSTEE